MTGARYFRITPLIRAVAVIVGLALGGVPLAAQQPTPVAFLHGLHGSVDTWHDTAERLSGPIALTPLVPTLEWTRPYAEQADALRYTSLSTLPANGILIGHSNGGIVAREWTRTHKVDGVVTLGTPHRGAPLLPHFLQWAGFQGTIPALIGETVQVFNQSSNWSWVFTYVANALSWAGDFSLFSVFSLAATLGLDVTVPVTADMHPSSFYLSNLNAPDNLVREQSWIPNRVGIVSVAHNFFYAGPARAAVPDYADDIAVAMYGAAFGLAYWGSYILTEADPTDFRASEQGLSLLSIAGLLLAVDPTFCRIVSSTDMSRCVENDGVVPYTSQEYPGAANLYINDGPAHTVETARTDDVLFHALVHYMHVPERGQLPVPPPPPPPPVPPPTEDPQPGQNDPPQAGTEQPQPPNDPASPFQGSMFLQRDQLLNPGEFITSANGQYFFVYQGDNNLVLYDSNWIPMWASNTCCTDAGVAVMQGDGNFVIYDRNGVPSWATGTNGHPDSALMLQDDGNVVVYDPYWVPWWHTGTAR